MRIYIISSGIMKKDDERNFVLRFNVLYYFYYNPNAYLFLLILN